MEYREIIDKIKKLQMNYDRAKKVDRQRAKRYMNQIKDLRVLKEKYEFNNQGAVITEQIEKIAELEEKIEAEAGYTKELLLKIEELEAHIQKITTAVEPEPEEPPEIITKLCPSCERPFTDDKMAEHQANCLHKN